MASATVVRSSLPMRSSAVSAASASARHVQHSRSGNLTFVTVLSTKTDPEAVQGVLGLHRSLKRVRAAHPLLCLCVNVSNDALGMLQTDGIQVREVAPIAVGHPGAFGKLQVLRLLDYRRVLFLDVDTIVLRNIDHLFELQCDFAFAPDIGFEVSASKMNLINAGVFVHTPHQGIYNDMVAHKETFTSLSGEPFLQEFINANRETLDGRMSICDLDIMYNVKRQLFLGHPSLWNCLRQEVAVMQFGGRSKPWHYSPTTSLGTKAANRAPSETSAKGNGGKSGGANANASHVSRGLNASASHLAAKAHEQPKPTSNDPLFSIWWVMFEERRFRELPYAKRTTNSSEVEAAVEAGDLNCGVTGIACPSRSENCIHRYLAHHSFAISNADLHALPAMIVGLVVAMMWLFLLVYASLCPERVVRRAISGVQTGARYGKLQTT